MVLACVWLVCVCVCAYICSCMCAGECVCILLCECMCIHVFTCIHVYVSVCTHVNTWAYICTCEGYAYMCACYMYSKSLNPSLYVNPQSNWFKLSLGLGVVFSSLNCDTTSCIQSLNHQTANLSKIPLKFPTDYENTEPHK